MTDNYKQPIDLTKVPTKKLLRAYRIRNKFPYWQYEFWLMEDEMPLDSTHIPSSYLFSTEEWARMSDRYEGYTSYKSIKVELDKRGHVPNKEEGKISRRIKAKRLNNKSRKHGRRALGRSR